MTSYEPMYDINDKGSFALALAPIITKLVKVGATEQLIDKVIGFHVKKWLDKQEEKGLVLPWDAPVPLRERWDLWES